MRRVPILPTLIVGLAVTVMILLGIWQIQRAAWKDGLIARYAANAGRPIVDFRPADGDAMLYRRAEGECLPPVSWASRAGRNRAGESGWRQVALCAGGMAFDMGWSTRPDSAPAWTGGRVRGVIDTDRDHVLILVAETPAPGLQAGEVPSPAGIPNNHRAYAVQWFLFATLAAAIYALALRRKLAHEGAGR